MLGSASSSAWGQGTALPNPRLLTVFPPGGRAGTVVEVTFTGSDVEEPQALLFSNPAIKAQPIIPPSPPPDPKKPAAPMPPPPVTKFKVTIPADTPVGNYDVRLVNKWGVSNPRAFAVGDLAEVVEQEPNNEVEQAQRIALNSTVNGTLGAASDVDYFVFAGKKGQRVVIRCLTSAIESRLHAALELFDRGGHRLAFNHDYRGHDALVDSTLPADGDYLVRLHEFTYGEGDAEHFYRLTVSTAPWIDAVFPPVIEPGKTAMLTVFGRNLPGGQLDPTAVVDGRALEKVTVPVPVPADPAGLQRLGASGNVPPTASGLDGFEYRIGSPVGVSNPYLLTYARAPVVIEKEGNDTADAAQDVPIPCEIAGRIDRKGDKDWYAFHAKKGDVFGIEVFGERLGSPCDLYFVVRNAATKQDLGEFDDNPETLNPVKFFTGTSDPPRFRFVAPADGKYLLLVSSRDASVRWGPRQLYRVSITPEQPDFRLVVMPGDDDRPDSCRLLQGGHEYFTALAWRLDGFNGTIKLTAEGLPPGVTSPLQSIGTGLKQAPLVLTAAANATPGVWEFKVKGTATINGKPVVREARAAAITWPVQPGQGIPTVTRLDPTLMLAVRDKAPYTLAAIIDKPQLVQGDKANLTLKLARLWPDFKTPLQVAVMDLPPNLVINNNQPATMAPGKDDLTIPVEAQPAVLPGVYSIVLRTTTQIPFNKDPAAKEKPPTNVVLPSAPVVLTILPKQVATLALPNPNVTAKVGTQSEVVVKLSRMHDFAGEFKVQVVVPPSVKGVSAGEATVAAGHDEAKIILRVAPDAAPGNRPDLLIRATALVNGTVPTTHEIKFAVNVVK
jgi:hypothetical protein